MKNTEEVKTKIKEIAKGIIEDKDINKIKEIFTIKELHDNSYEKIPEKAGVYFVVNLGNKNITFVEKVENAISEYNGKSLIYTNLNEKYNKTDKTILYIGKADKNSGTNRGLRKRLSEYIRYGYGEYKSHRGGRAIWQIQDGKGNFICNQLGICWIEIEGNSEKIETELIRNYENNNNQTFPVANWRL